MKQLAQFGADERIDLGGVLPQQGDVAVPSRFATIPNAIATIFNFVIVISAVIFIILLLVGGIQYLTSAGNEEATAKARRLMVDAIVGLVIVLAAWAIGTFVLNRLGFNVGGFGFF